MFLGVRAGKGREEQRSSLTCVVTAVVTETEGPLSVPSHKPNLVTVRGRRERLEQLEHKQCGGEQGQRQGV